MSCQPIINRSWHRLYRPWERLARARFAFRKRALLGITLAFQVQAACVAQGTAVPSWGIGPFLRPTNAEPVIRPNAASTFYCPMRKKYVNWEITHTFNPAAIVREGKIHVIYRAEDDQGSGIGGFTSRLGLATSDDGLTFARRSAPVLFPDDGPQRIYDWYGGCEDPRVCEAEDGRYILTYTAWSRANPFGSPVKARLSVASSADLVNWTKHGPAFEAALDGKYKDTFTKSASIVQKIVDGRPVAVRINGKYWMYWGESGLYLAWSTDLLNWTPLEDANGNLITVLPTRSGKFDSSFAEGGPLALLTKDGIVVVYNGKNASSGGDPNVGPGAYSGGQALFSASDPTVFLDRMDTPFFAPELSWEKSGQYTAGTTFLEGMAYFHGDWYLYYGCADTFVGVATTGAQRSMSADHPSIYMGGLTGSWNSAADWLPAKVPGANDDATVGNLYTTGGNATWRLALGADTTAASFTYANLEGGSSSNRNLVIASNSTTARTFTVENFILNSGPDGTRSIVFGGTTSPVALSVTGTFYGRGGELNTANATGNAVSLNSVAVERGMTTLVGQANAKITMAGGATLSRAKGALLRAASSGNCLFTNGFSAAMTSGEGGDAIAIGVRGPGENFVAAKPGAVTTSTYAAANSWTPAKNVTITSSNSGYGPGIRAVNALRMGASVTLDPTAQLTLTSGGLIFGSSGNTLSGGTLTSGAGVNEVWIVNGYAQNTVDSLIANNGNSVDLSLFSNPGDWKGGGYIALTAANTHSGVTRVGSGQLRIGHSLALQNSTLDVQSNDLSVGSVAFASTVTTVTFGALRGTKNLELTNLGGIAVSLKVGNNGMESPYYGVISGGGSLEKIGGGDLILHVPQNYTGGTRISGGNLILKDNSLLPAESSVEVESGAGLVVQPSSQQWINSGLTVVKNEGRLQVSGSVTNSGTLRLYGDAVLNVSGAVTNQGVIDAIAWKGTLPAGLVNQGVILDKSSVKVDSVEMMGQNVVLKMFCHAGHSYQLQAARGGNLSGPWDNVGAVTLGNGTVTTFTIPAGGSESGFYRVIVDP